VKKSPIYILGIESSCDETSAAVSCNTHILSNIIASQTIIHRYYGGVVPELASRAHLQKIIPVVDEALKYANVSKTELRAVSFTRGPGLMGALLVGTSFAKAFALTLDIPLIEVNHLQAHVLAHFIDNSNFVEQSDQHVTDQNSKSQYGYPATENKQSPPRFPFLCLTVSGGHTQIVLVKDYLQMEIIGESLDDAAGEAFDKAAKVIGLDYPGGPLIDKIAKTGNPFAFKFPHPQIEKYDFSFSGLKTAFLYFIRDQLKEDALFIEKNKADICASIQQTIVDILIRKLEKASAETGINEIAIAGGVSANSALRNAMDEKRKNLHWNIFIPKMEYCTDNAAMIAITGYYKYLNDEFTNQAVFPLANNPY
jgi:N6-L-threonylcarbamoyladenine synthase